MSFSTLFGSIILTGFAGTVFCVAGLNGEGEENGGKKKKGGRRGKKAFFLSPSPPLSIRALPPAPPPPPTFNACYASHRNAYK